MITGGEGAANLASGDIRKSRVASAEVMIPSTRNGIAVARGHPIDTSGISVRIGRIAVDISETDQRPTHRDTGEESILANEVMIVDTAAVRALPAAVRAGSSGAGSDLVGSELAFPRPSLVGFRGGRADAD